jgi:hypothetical protein
MRRRGGIHEFVLLSFRRGYASPCLVYRLRGHSLTTRRVRAVQSLRSSDHFGISFMSGLFSCAYRHRRVGTVFSLRSHGFDEVILTHIEVSLVVERYQK